MKIQTIHFKLKKGHISMTKTTLITNIGIKVRALAYSIDGSQIAAATYDGKVIILSDDLQIKAAEISLAKSWIQCLSYSPDGQTLAVGSHDSYIYILSTKSYTCLAKCKGHHAYITALDYSRDGTKLQSASGDYELLYWDVSDGKQILSATEMRDAQWYTTTCTLGWGVQGIWPKLADGTDVNSVDKSPDGSIIATGDDFRRIKLFKYPSPLENSEFKEYKGHSEFVVNIKFSKDGKWLFSVGGLDKAIMQFEVKNGTKSISSNKEMTRIIKTVTPSNKFLNSRPISSKSVKGRKNR
jgi:WD40 repeat protein